MPGRKYSAATQYRYGFNGKENDNDVKGEGNQQDYGMRIYDPRLGRFLSVDPLTSKYPFYTPYSFSGNKPIWRIDLDGAEDWPSFNQAQSVQDAYNKKIANITDKDLKAKISSAWNEASLHYNNFVMRDRKLSAYNMYRYLEGKGGYDIYSYSELSKSDFLSFWSVNRQVRNAIVKDIDSKASILASTQGKGTYYLITSEASLAKGQGAPMASDFGTAFGSFQVLAKGIFTVTIDDNGNYSYSGNVFYTFRDTYKWHPGRGGVDEFVNHSKMESLKQLGAKDFFIRSYYYQKIQGQNDGSLKVGEMKDSTDPNYHQTEQQGQYYTMPDGTPLINIFRKT